MNYLEYKLPEGGFINRFLTAGVFTRDNPFRKTVLQGKVNEWLSKGSAIHDNPCRKEVREERVGRTPPYADLSGLLPGDEVEAFGQRKKLRVYFPFGNTGVDESGFYRTPKYLRSYGYVCLNVPESEEAGLALSVCGALTIWLNGELVADFVPFLRNQESRTIVHVALRKGINALAVCVEDLAERDTGFIYKARYLGGQDIRMRVPVSDDTDTEAIRKAEVALSRMYFRKEAYFSEPVALNLEAFSDAPAEMTLIPDGGFAPRRYTIEPGQKEIPLFHSGEIPSAFYLFRVDLTVSGILISKVIGTYSGNRQFTGLYEESYEERKKQIRDIIRNADTGSDYRAVIRLHDGETPDNLAEILANHLGWVNEKRDCSDFRLIIMTYMYVRFADRFPEKLRRDVEDAMLGYRYWIDEPGDDVMWFFSENHALMFHICQYFAGKALPDRVFAASGLTGEEASDKAERLLGDWFEHFMTEFATEWNSSTYLPIDLMGLAYLYDLTEKGSALHEKAKEALDMLARCLAINEHKGSLMTSFGRTYEKELKGSLSTGMPSLLYLFYNAGHMNEHFRALVPIIVGDYEPPREYGRYVRLAGDEELIHQNTQGIDRFVNLYLYKNAKALLSTAVGLRPYSPGYQENVVQATLDGTAQVFVNHPGESEPYGNGRPGFWAGNGSLPLAVQHRNVSVLVYRIGAEALLPYTHAYIPLSEFSSCAVGSDSVALEKGGGYIGVRALNGLSMTEEGSCRRREFISPGRENVWILKVGRAGEYQSAEELLRDMERMEITLEENRASVAHGDARYVIEGSILRVNGERAHNYPLDVTGTLEITGGNEDGDCMPKGI